jgi:hypothetical protein
MVKYELNHFGIGKDWWKRASNSGD